MYQRNMKPSKRFHPISDELLYTLEKDYFKAKRQTEIDIDKSKNSYSYYSHPYAEEYILFMKFLFYIFGAGLFFSLTIIILQELKK